MELDKLVNKRRWRRKGRYALRWMRRGWLIQKSWGLIHKDRELMRTQVGGVEFTWVGCYTTTYHFECNAGLTTMGVIVGFPA